jgi:hypothetical protein
MPRPHCSVGWGGGPANGVPGRLNDGSPVPDELVGQTIVELRQQFRAISVESQVIRGHWQHQGEEFRDELVRLFVDVPDTEAPPRSRRSRLAVAQTPWRRNNSR